MSYAEYDDEGNMIDARGMITVPREVVSQYISHVRQSGLPQVGFRAAGLATNLTSTMRGGQMSSFPARAGPPAPPPSGTGYDTSPPASSPSTFAHPSNPPALHRRAHSAGASNTHHSDLRTSNTYFHPAPPPQAPADLAAAAAAAAAADLADSAYHASTSSWLPQDPASGLGFDASNIDSLTDQNRAWHSDPDQSGLVYGHAPHRPRHPAPSIRVTTEFASPAHQTSQPQDAIYSASSAPSLPPGSEVFQYHNTNPYYQDHLSPNAQFPMPPESDNMQTPVSPISGQGSPHEVAVMVQQPISRKRSHSVMSQQELPQMPNIHPHSDSGASIVAVSPNENNDEPYSPRGSRTIKRGDPPTNMDNKYICEFAIECQGMTFDRKCEWSKHMDKHDRPYRCTHLSCAKLQGFTYSGGLLRHEREVHGKHGGPKAQLMCPHPDCKRHNGKGFTRKENLNEHLRRVHPKDGTGQESQMSQVSTLRRDGTDIAFVGPEDEETPASRISEPADHDEYVTDSPAIGKRKRTYTDGVAPDGADDRDEEIKRLRLALDHEREARRLLEEDTYKYQEEIRRLNLIQAQDQQQQG